MRVKTWIHWLVLSTLFLGYSFQANANDEALYGPVAPPGSTFVRIVNLTSKAIQEAKVGNEIFRGIGSFSGTGYKFLPAGNPALQIQTFTQSFPMSSGHYYSVVMTGEGNTQILEDAGKPDARKATISLYNLSTSDSLSLKTADGKIAIINNVAKAGRGDRAINPVKLELAVFTPTPVAVQAIALERSQVFSLFVTSSNGQIIGTWIKQ